MKLQTTVALSLVLAGCVQRRHDSGDNYPYEPPWDMGTAQDHCPANDLVPSEETPSDATVRFRFTGVGYVATQGNPNQSCSAFGISKDDTAGESDLLLTVPPGTACETASSFENASQQFWELNAATVEWNGEYNAAWATHEACPPNGSLGYTCSTTMRTQSRTAEPGYYIARFAIIRALPEDCLVGDNGMAECTVASASPTADPAHAICDVDVSEVVEVRFRLPESGIVNVYVDVP